MEVTKENNQNSDNSNQVAQNSAGDPLKISNEDIKQVLQVKCKRHPERFARLLHLIPDVKNARICNMCVQEDDIQRKNYQDIREFFLDPSERDLLSYPVLTDSELGVVIQNIGDNMEQETIQMDNFFQELSDQIQVKIKERKEARKQKLMQYGRFYQDSKAIWSEIIDLENLQRILVAKNNEDILAQFVNGHVSNAEINTERIKTIYDQFGRIKNEFSMEQPNKIKNLACTILGEINFFEGAHPSPLHSIEQSEEYQNALQRKLEDSQSQSNQVMKDQQELLLEEMRILKEKHSLEVISLQQHISDLQENIDDQQEEISDLEQKCLEIGAGSQSFQTKNLLPRTKLILANYFCFSKKLSVSKDYSNNLEFSNNQNTYKYSKGFCYLNFVLDPSINYVVHVEMEQTKGQNKYFLFGLFPNSEKDATEELNGCIYYSELEDDPGHINTLLKGNAIKADRFHLQTRSLEMRINIERQFLRVGSLPNYDSVVEVDYPELIEPATPYRFFLFGLNKKTKMRITKLETVSHFNYLM